MINYSIVMRSINSNLLEINQAKGRIKYAKEHNQEPAQADLDLVKTEKQHAYAIAQYADVMNIEKFARHISSHGCVYSRADISAILYMAVDCMREMLLEGKKIRLGDLGDFSVSLASKGAESADKFSAQNITAVNVNWECGAEFKNLLADAEFNLVASRKAQQAVISAIKDGKTVVDLNNPDGSPTDGPSDGQQTESPNGGQQTTDNGQQTGGGNTQGGGTDVNGGDNTTPPDFG
ncbi:MAG: DNA-binding protein [Bacteroidaceae bacterium]|nr:DNA-binding protein [Bacteroidaceae bacterium]